MLLLRVEIRVTVISRMTLLGFCGVRKCGFSSNRTELLNSSLLMLPMRRWCTAILPWAFCQLRAFRSIQSHGVVWLPQSSTESSLHFYLKVGWQYSWRDRRLLRLFSAIIDLPRLIAPSNSPKNLAAENLRGRTRDVHEEITCASMPT